MTGKKLTGLVEEARSGDLQSFAALYEHYYSAMVAIAYSVLADHHLAEDAAQQAFAVACRDLLKLKKPERFGSWLGRICRNSAIDMLRAVSRSNSTEMVETAAAPEERNSSELAEAIRKSVWGLKPFYREPVVMRYYDGLSYEKIAQVLGISTQAVNGRIFRAKKKIEKQLKRNSLTGANYECT